MSKVYQLKRATPKMKYQHMRYVLDWKADLAESQAKAREAIREETMRLALEIRESMTQEQYDSWWATTPDDDRGFLDACRAKFGEIERARQQAESDEIAEWLDDRPVYFSNGDITYLSQLCAKPQNNADETLIF